MARSGERRPGQQLCAQGLHALSQFKRVLLWPNLVIGWRRGKGRSGLSEQAQCSIQDRDEKGAPLRLGKKRRQRLLECGQPAAQMRLSTWPAKRYMSG
jgi:hypothetical protein